MDERKIQKEWNKSINQSINQLIIQYESYFFLNNNEKMEGKEERLENKMHIGKIEQSISFSLSELNFIILAKSELA